MAITEQADVSYGRVVADVATSEEVCTTQIQRIPVAITGNTVNSGMTSGHQNRECMDQDGNDRLSGTSSTPMVLGICSPTSASPTAVGHSKCIPLKFPKHRYQASSNARIHLIHSRKCHIIESHLVA